MHIVLGFIFFVIGVIITFGILVLIGKSIDEIEKIGYNKGVQAGINEMRQALVSRGLGKWTTTFSEGKTKTYFDWLPEDEWPKKDVKQG